MLYFHKTRLLQILDITAVTLFLLSACSCFLTLAFWRPQSQNSVDIYTYCYFLMTLAKKTADEVQKFQWLGGWETFAFLGSSGGVQPNCHNSLAL